MEVCFVRKFITMNKMFTAELNDEMMKLKVAREENAKLLANLQNVSAERDDLKTAVFITETSNMDELTIMKSKYQEEIASLKAIMHGN